MIQEQGLMISVTKATQRSVAQVRIEPALQ
jgi:hypothetical protein